tara:strand:- start:318 stop:1352 length:1035 start_codon:yes stop_codon:yes gene_type:complete
MAVYTTIDDAGAFFEIILYTGTGSSLGVTGAGFEPAFTWIKNRADGDFHVLTDAVRGATKYIKSDTTTAETTDAESLKSFDSDGFTVGTQNEVNTNTETYVGWNWKAGTTTGIAGSPSITPASYSFNATSGFSVIKYVGNSTGGATLPHGLGVAPQVIIVKNLTTAGTNWGVYSEAIGATKYLVLDTDAVVDTATSLWNDTAATSTLFSIGTSSIVNTNTDSYVAYCFTEITGYSRFGSYEGNGNVNGTYVYTGFRPAFLMCKAVDSSGGWYMFDDKRAGYNVDNDTILANTTAGDEGTDKIDILSNGFKLRHATDPNVAETYIYMAFANSPFVNSNGAPANAR